MDNQMSDELKLQLIKTQFNNLMMCVKMQITIQTTLEAYRQYVSGELPEVFNDVVETEAFKDTFNQAVQASTEVLQNLITFTDNVGSVFGIDFRAQLPKNNDDLNKMTKDLHDEIQNQRKSNEEFDLEFKENN
jgi:ABC-type transporter Mla subunit MlaD